MLIISCVIVILVLTSYQYAIRKKNLKLIVLITLADLIINTAFYLPVTGIGQASLQTMQSYYDQSPPGIPIPEFIPVAQYKNNNDDERTLLIGNWSYFSKQPGCTQLTGYPSYFNYTSSFFKSNDTAAILSRPWIFLINESGQNKHIEKMNVVEYSPDRIDIKLATVQNDTLVFLQNHYKHWKAIVNGKETPLQIYRNTFLALELMKGEQHILLYYSDNILSGLMVIAALLFACLVVYCFLFKNRLSKNSKDSDAIAIVKNREITI
jgi:hypothetical protein